MLSKRLDGFIIQVEPYCSVVCLTLESVIFPYGENQKTSFPHREENVNYILNLDIERG